MILDNLVLEHQDSNKSLRRLAKEIGITRGALAKIFAFYYLPIKTKEEATRQESKTPP